jgi:DNA-directed RNA polymerase specialized sigma24 family protein
MTYDDMARWIGVARATVSDRLARGREILRRQLLTVGRTLHEV